VAHRLSQPAHPWTNGPVERLNRTSKEATGQRFPYQTTDARNEPLHAFLLAYNHAKRLKTVRGLTPHEVVCAQWILLANSSHAYCWRHQALESGLTGLG
jgi:transposase InsO family protein